MLSLCFEKIKNIPEDIKLELEAKKAGWLIVKNPEKEESIELALTLSLELGLGESYAIALSKELNADLLIMNDKKARDIANKLGINTKWTTEVLIEAISRKLINSYNNFIEILDAMIDNGLWIEKDYYENLLENAKKIFQI